MRARTTWRAVAWAAGSAVCTAVAAGPGCATTSTREALVPVAERTLEPRWEAGPAERRQVECPSPVQEVATVYDLRAQGAVVTLSRVRAEAERLRGKDQTVIRVRVTVENRGPEPLWLDPDRTRLEELRVGGQVLAVAPLTQVQPVAGRALAVPAGSTRAFDLWFAVPAGVSPQDVDAATIRWTLRSPRGVVTRAAPFVEPSETPGWWYPPLG